jgi:hypothetical protein
MMGGEPEGAYSPPAGVSRGRPARNTTYNVLDLQA